nr:hypothetical protein [Nitrosomonas nitrosa]
MARTPSRDVARPKVSSARRQAKSIKKPPRPATIFISQTAAKNRFLAHCRHVIAVGEFVCVQDQSGDAFLTLTPRPVKGPTVTVSAQFFKDNFSRCSSLIRDGLAFRLTLRSSNQVLYARRHTAYRDPLDHVIDEWRESIVETAMADADESVIARLARDFTAFAQRQHVRSEDDRETTRNHYQALVRGITRMAIGHLPFDEGMLPSNRDPSPRQLPPAH